MCGSGTLVIEAALIAADVPPNLWREYFGFLGWRQHDAALWRELLAAARERAQAGVARMQSHVVGGGAAAGGVRFFGSDRDPEAIRAARANAERAGVAGWTQFALADVAACQVPSVGMGLVAVNPPYGERLEDRERARELHRLLGKTLQSRFMGWQAAVLTGAPDLGLELGLRAERTHKLWNGPLECRLLRFDLQPEAVRDLRPNARAEVDTALAATNGAQMFGNRLTKNIKRLKSWVQRADVSCYRLYDADMPEYAFAIDRYAAANGERTWLYVQEYAAPEEIPRDEVRRRRGEVLATLPLVTGVAPEDIHLRVRRRMSGSAQYEKSAASGEFHVVAESGLKFAVNFRDYLDTGLFLDHRLTRQRIRALAAGKRFLNLFAYTGTATVYAAAGGAVSTVSVDLSHTYIDWARRNLKLNALDSPRNTYDHADCREWLKSVTGEFDLIFLDPPTFSNSARMQGTLAVERDHAELIAGCIRLLAPEGLLLFSTNAQRFKLDGAIEKSYAVTDISRATLPEDFARNPRIHRCFEIRR
jgi:23S rRNA (guanine2445-N2)-methyltransferase / 23S rRNA (guanine2069-N7)-methyltransferase